MQLGSRGLGDLQKMCDERGISRAAGQKKATLVGLLEEWRRTQNSSSGKRKAEAPAQPAKKAKTSKAPAAAPTAAATGVRAKKLEEFLKEHSVLGQLVCQPVLRDGRRHGALGDRGAHHAGAAPISVVPLRRQRVGDPSLGPRLAARPRSCRP